MDYEGTVKISNLLMALIPIIFLLGLLFIILRTQSLFVLRRRIWALIHGEQNLPNDAVNDFLREQSSLMAFRMFSGICAKNLKIAEDLISWAKLKGIDLSELSRCGRYFDPTARRILVENFPKRLRRLFIVISASLLYSISVIFLFATIYDGVFLYSNDQGELFVAKKEKVFRLFQSGEALTFDKCNKLEEFTFKGDKFNLDQVNYFCKLIVDDSWAHKFGEDLKAQRWASFVLFLMLIFPTIVIVSEIRSLDAAKRIANHQSTLNGDLIIDLKG